MPLPTALGQTRIQDGELYRSESAAGGTYIWVFMGNTVRATGSSTVDLALLEAACAHYREVIVDDGDSPLVLHTGNGVDCGDTTIRGIRPKTRINLFDSGGNTTQMRFGEYLNTASHAAWPDCTVSADGKTVSAPTVTGVVEGDILLVIAEDIIQGQSPHHTGGDTRPMEFSVVESVSGTTFELMTPLVDTYTVSPKCYLFKRDGSGGTGVNLAINSGLIDIDFTGSSNTSPGGHATGVIFRCAYKAEARNVLLSNSGHLLFQNTYQCYANDVHCDGQDEGHLDYGISVSGGCENIVRRYVGRDCRHHFTTSAQSNGLTRYGTLRRNRVEDSIAYVTASETPAQNTNIAWDVHAEGYETEFRNCIAYAGGELYDQATAPRPIGFNGRARRTRFVQCQVVGDVRRHIRGFIVSASDCALIDCVSDGTWQHVTLGPRDGYTAERLFVSGGKFSNSRNDAIILDGGDGHIVQGATFETWGSETPAGWGAINAAVSVANHENPAAIPTNVQIRNNSFTKSGAASVGFWDTDIDDIRLEGNEFIGYDRTEIGLDRTQAISAEIERRWSARNNRRDYLYVNRTAHGLVIEDDEHKPVDVDGNLHDGTESAGDLAGVLVDVIDSSNYVVAATEQQVTMPATKVSDLGSYDPTSDGAYLRYDSVQNGYSVSGTGPGPVILETVNYDADNLIAKVAARAAEATGGGGGSLRTISTVANLSTTTPDDGEIVWLAGYYAAYDGGGQMLRYFETGRSGQTMDDGWYHAGGGADDYYAALKQDVANAKVFGARGDGATDDRVRLQAAIDTLKPVRLPASDPYIVSNAGDAWCLQYYDNTVIYGDGIGRSTIKLIDGETATNSRILSSSVARSNVFVHDLTLDGNRANWGGTAEEQSAGFFTPRDASHITLLRVEGTRCNGDGARIMGDFVTVRDCEFHDNYRIGLNVVSSDNVLVEGNHIWDSDIAIKSELYSGVSGEIGHDIAFIGNTITANQCIGINRASAVASHYEGVKIVGNSFEQYNETNGTSGPFQEGGANRAIYMRGVQGCSVTGNSFRHGSDAGFIQMGAENHDIEIVGNSFVDQVMLVGTFTPEAAISIGRQTTGSNNSNIKITGNTFSNTLSVLGISSPTNPKSGTFTVSAATNIFTSNGHGLSKNDTVYLTSTGTLPAPLATDTKYWVINPTADGNTFQLSEAFNGPAIDLTNTGSGTHTFNQNVVNENVTFDNNTCQAVGGAFANTQYGLHIRPCDRINITNNTIEFAPTVAVTQYALYVQTGGWGDSTDVTFDNNRVTCLGGYDLLVNGAVNFRMRNNISYTGASGWYNEATQAPSGDGYESDNVPASPGQGAGGGGGGLATIDTVSDLTSYAAVDGETYQLLGYWAPGDGGDQLLTYHETGAGGVTIDNVIYFNGGGDSYYETAEKFSISMPRAGLRPDDNQVGNPNTTQLQAAINYLRANGGEIYVPAGVWFISQLDWTVGDRPVKVRGDGHNATSAANVLWASDIRSTLANSTEAIHDLKGADNLVFEDCAFSWYTNTFTGALFECGVSASDNIRWNRCYLGGTTGSNNNAFGIKTDLLTNATISDCHIRFCLAGIGNQTGLSTTAVQIKGCSFENNRQYNLLNPGHAYVISGNKFHRLVNGDAQAVTTDLNGFVVNGFVFSGNETYGSTSNIGWWVDVAATGAMISGNNFQNDVDAAIRWQENSHGCSVIGNTCACKSLVDAKVAFIRNHFVAANHHTGSGPMISGIDADHHWWIHDGTAKSRQAWNVNTIADLSSLLDVEHGTMVDTLGGTDVADGGGRTYVYYAVGRSGETMDGVLFVPGGRDDDYFEAIHKDDPGGGGGDSRWTEMDPSNYTALPPNSSTISMVSTAGLERGMPIKLTQNAVEAWYNITVVNPSAINVAGPALDTGNAITSLSVGTSELGVVASMFIAGTFGDDVDSALLVNDMNGYFSWMHAPARLVEVYVINKTADTGTNPFVNIFIGGTQWTSGNGFQCGGAGEIWGSGNTIDPANYRVEPGTFLDVGCTVAGAVGDASDLTAVLKFVLE